MARRAHRASCRAADRMDVDELGATRRPGGRRGARARLGTARGVVAPADLVARRRPVRRAAARPSPASEPSGARHDRRGHAPRRRARRRRARLGPVHRQCHPADAGVRVGPAGVAGADDVHVDERHPAAPRLAEHLAHVHDGLRRAALDDLRERVHDDRDDQPRDGRDVHRRAVAGDDGALLRHAGDARHLDERRLERAREQRVHRRAEPRRRDHDRLLR